MALALFPLTYVRHLWNAGYEVILGSVFVIFLVWTCLGCVGQMVRDRADSHDSGPGFRLNMRAIFFSLMLLAFFLTALSMAWSSSGARMRGSLMYLVSVGMTTLPVLIVQIVGFTMVFRKRAAYPKMSKYALLGIGGLVLISLLTVLSPFFGFSSFFGGGSNTTMLVYVWSTTFLFSLINVICWMLIIMAVLADRRVE